jgi:hypothetical protein
VAEAKWGSGGACGIHRLYSPSLTKGVGVETAQKTSTQRTRKRKRPMTPSEDEEDTRDLSVAEESDLEDCIVVKQH